MDRRRVLESALSYLFSYIWSLTYLDLAHVQDTNISCLPRGLLTDKDVLLPYHTRNSTSLKMQYIDGKIS